MSSLRAALFLLLLLCTLPGSSRAQLADILDTPELAEPDLEPMPDDDDPPPPEPLFEKQKRLLYLLARLKRSLPARPLAARILTQAPSDKETLLVLASMELERKNAAGVLHYARRFLKFYPKDDQGWYFISAAESLMGHHAAAKGILEKMRAELFADRDFPYQVDLASTARLSGDWRTALAVYKELLQDGQTARPLREEARRIIDEIYREQLPRVNLSANYQHLFSTGDILRTDAAWESPLTNRIRLFLNLHRDDLSQKANGSLKSLRDSRMEGTAGIEAHLAQSWHLTAEAGGSSAGFLAAAGLRRQITPTRSWFVGGNYNQRATDSLSLEILDGRQSRAFAGFDWTLDDESNWRVAGTAYGRVATVDSQLLGHGWGLEWQVERVLVRDPVNIRLAYIGQYSRFDTTSTDASLVQPLFDPGATPAQEVEALDFEGIIAGSPETLIDPEISYQGLSLTARRDILPQWSLELTGVFGYYLDSSQLNYGGYVRNTWRPRKSMEILASAGYMSSGAQSNTGSEVFELSLALQWLF